MTLLDVRAPGLYLRGRESEVPPALTSGITGFVGVAPRGPLHLPQRLRSWGEYLQVFGGFVAYGYLAESVYGFFLNGGEECYVVRSADTRDRSLENEGRLCPVALELAVARPGGLVVDHQGSETLRVRAINPGSWGNTLHLEVEGESTQDLALTTLRVAGDPALDTIEVAGVSDLAPGARIRIADAHDGFTHASYQVAAILSDTTVRLTGPLLRAFARGSTVYGRGFRMRVRHDEQGQEETFDNLSIDPDHPRFVERVVNGEADATAYLERQARGHSILVRVERVGAHFKPLAVILDGFQGGADGYTQARATLNDEDGAPSLTVVARRVLGAAGNELRVRAEPFTTTAALPVPVQAGGPKNRIVVEQVDGFVAGDQVTVTTPDGVTSESALVGAVDAPAGDHALQLTAELVSGFPIGSTVVVADRFTLSVFEGDRPQPAEVYRNLSINSGDARFVHPLLEAAGATVCAAPAGGAGKPPEDEVHLARGRDPGEIDYRFYTGYDGGSFYAAPGVSTAEPVGLAALEAVGDVSLVAIPDLDRAVTGEPGAAGAGAFLAGQQDLLFHCAKLGERFALLDPPGDHSQPDLSVGDVESWPEGFSDLHFTKFGALYFPWLDGAFPDGVRRVPPAGFVAGVTALTDRAQGVQKSPANVPVKGAVDLATWVDWAISERLNPKGVNCLRKLQSGAIQVMGGRTLSPALANRYVSVRRVLLSVVQALSRHLLWVAFEPNDAVLWKRLESSVDRYLATLVAGGLTAGTRPSESFYVKCNQETNPPEVIAAGQVVAEIGLALTAPAEFVVLTVRATPESFSIIEADA